MAYSCIFRLIGIVKINIDPLGEFGFTRIVPPDL